jgi:hypothetical protein
MAFQESGLILRILLVLMIAEGKSSKTFFKYLKFKKNLPLLKALFKSYIETRWQTCFQIAF